jgi:hypothetical protein
MAALLALTVTVALAGCSPAPSTSSSGHADLARLVALEHDFPPGFSVHAGEVQQAHAQVVDQVGTTVSYGKSFAVDPPQCRALLKPVDGTVGANFLGLRGDGPDEQTIYVGADDQVTVPAKIPATGCDRITFDVDSALPNGTASRIAAPKIAGATITSTSTSTRGCPRAFTLSRFSPTCSSRPWRPFAGASPDHFSTAPPTHRRR